MEKCSANTETIDGETTLPAVNASDQIPRDEDMAAEQTASKIPRKRQSRFSTSGDSASQFDDKENIHFYFYKINLGRFIGDSRDTGKAINNLVKDYNDRNRKKKQSFKGYTPIKVISNDLSQKIFSVRLFIQQLHGEASINAMVREETLIDRRNNSVLFYWDSQTVIAATTGKGWAVINGKQDMQFTEKVAMRILDGKGIFACTKRYLFGSKRKDTCRYNLPTLDPFFFSVGSIVEEYTAMLRPNSSAYRLPCFNNKKDIRVVVGLRKVGFKFGFNLSDLESVVEYLVKIDNGETTFSYPENEEEDSCMLYRRKFIEATELRQTLNDILLKYMHREVLDFPQPVLKQFDICDNRVEDFLNCRELEINACNIKVGPLSCAQNLSEVLKEYKSTCRQNNSKPKIFKPSTESGKYFSRWTYSFKSSYNETFKGKFVKMIEGSLMHEGQYYWRYQNSWYYFSSEYIIQVEKKFVAILKKHLMRHNSHPHLPLSWGTMERVKKAKPTPSKKKSDIPRKHSPKAKMGKTNAKSPGKPKPVESPAKFRDYFTRKSKVNKPNVNSALFSSDDRAEQSTSTQSTQPIAIATRDSNLTDFDKIKTQVTPTKDSKSCGQSFLNEDDNFSSPVPPKKIKIENEEDSNYTEPSTLDGNESNLTEAIPNLVELRSLGASNPSNPIADTLSHPSTSSTEYKTVHVAIDEGVYNLLYLGMPHYLVADKIFPERISIELFDLLYFNPKEGAEAYLYHVKNTFQGDATRAVCAQIYNSALVLFNVLQGNSKEFNILKEWRLYWHTKMTKMLEQFPDIPEYMKTDSKLKAILERVVFVCALRVHDKISKDVQEIQIRTYDGPNTPSLHLEKDLIFVLTESDLIKLLNDKNTDSNKYTEKLQTHIKDEGNEQLGVDDIARIIMNGLYEGGYVERESDNVLAKLLYCTEKDFVANALEKNYFCTEVQIAIKIIFKVLRPCRTYFNSLGPKIDVIRLCSGLHEMGYNTSQFKICEIRALD